MFTGIIETVGEVRSVVRDGGNIHLTIKSSVSDSLKIDQSVAHNGVCLTVVGLSEGQHTVTAIEETLQKTNLGSLKAGSLVNLERCMRLGDRLDGHMVQGHVDQTAVCVSVSEGQGSWLFSFRYQISRDHLVVEKGSICVNGISLTAFGVTDDLFTVAIIPYTYEHTNISHVRVGDRVNLEFDIVGKYIARLASLPGSG